MPRLREEDVLNLIANREYAKGRRRFILVNGILLFAIPMFVGMTGNWANWRITGNSA